MLTIVDGTNIDRHGAMMEDAYRLRHDVFVEEMGWEAIRKQDGREIDQFDDQHAVHFLIHEAGQLIGYQRLLPTTRPYLLTDVYPYLCDGEAPSGPHAWEWTRYAVAKGYRGRGRGLGHVGAELILAFIEWGQAKGVDRVVVEFHPINLLKFVQCGFLTMPLGVSHKIDGAETIAVEALFDHRTRARVIDIIETERAKMPKAA